MAAPKGLKGVNIKTDVYVKMNEYRNDLMKDGIFPSINELASLAMTIGLPKAYKMLKGGQIDVENNEDIQVIK